MLKYFTYDIVFQEFPDEVTLAVNLALCPNACPGCHSSFLTRDIGDELTDERLFALIEGYEGEITCVGLMGGDNDPARVAELLGRVKRHYGETLRTGWYSGRPELPDPFAHEAFDYVKTGPYIASQGPLNDPRTNQRLYRVEHPSGALTDITRRFWERRR